MALISKSKHPLYNTYSNILQRCYNSKNTNYSHYGGRGITICDRWLDKDNGFYAFLEDMGSKPQGAELDRIDSTKNYSPDNCRWANRTVQVLNRTTRKQTRSNCQGVEIIRNKFRARVRYNKKTIHIGMFETAEAAHQAYVEKVNELIRLEVS